MTAKKQTKPQTDRADGIQPGDRIEVRGIAGTVAKREDSPNDALTTIIALWWRADDDDPNLSPHRCHVRLADEDVILLRRASEEAGDG